MPWRAATLAACVVLFLHTAGSRVGAAPDATLWVVQPPGQLVAFDSVDFSRIGGVRIPVDAYDDPSKLAVNGHGQFLVQLDADHLWLWDGTKAVTLPSTPRLAGVSMLTPTGGHAPTRQWLLGGDGSSLFVVEGMAREANEAADSTVTSVRMLRTDLAQRRGTQIFSRTVRPCRRQMELVADTEPCPDPEVWAPGGVIRNCVVLTHWEQQGSFEGYDTPNTTCYRTRYRAATAKWTSSDLDTIWSEQPLLDISADGSAWVTTDIDGGCCGWSNDSSEQTYFHDGDTAHVVFNEWSVFGNKDYDVSFYTADARISPDAACVALSIHATAGFDPELRLSADGHADSLELRSVLASLADMPIVEVAQVRPHSAKVLRLPRTELIGWASDSELFVVQNRHVVAVDVLTGKRRRSTIEVRTAADALLVRP